MMKELELPFNSVVIFGGHTDHKVEIPSEKIAGGSRWYAVTSSDGKIFTDIRCRVKARSSESSGDDFSILHESIPSNPGAAEITIVNLETGEINSYESAA